jgi:L-cystine uptake protein TcyP (sodium:dicarboxylate symporter family)
MAYAHPATWILALLIGALLAVSFELWAVFADHRWQYAASMPLIPILQIGFTPVLQMIFIPLLVLSFTSRFSRPV